VSNDPGVVTISSEPTSANVKVYDERTGMLVNTGKTPHQVVLETSQGYFKPAHYKIRCDKEGYIGTEQMLNAGMDGWYVGNILFGGLIGWLIVDPATGAMWDIDEKNIALTLMPAQRISETPETIEENHILVRGKTL